MRVMDVNQPLALLGGLAPAAFMRRHWHKRPLLVRQAWLGARPPIARQALFALAARDDVESRLVVHQADDRWQLRRGPLPRRAVPPLGQPGWTLLVQGLDLHLDAAHAVLHRFRFIPDARLDDLMLSYASDGGGVGPHIDSYDVFLLQVQGRRRWRIGRAAPAAAAALREDVPLKMLAAFKPTHDWLLEPGDMLYLPPGWAHDGVAEGGDCMTCSIGFRAPGVGELAQALLGRLADDDSDSPALQRLYRDPTQAASASPGRVPAALQRFSHEAVARLVREPGAIDRVLGEWLTEPKPQVWFEAQPASTMQHGVRLDRRTRMAYDTRHVFINGEAFRAAGRDARLVQSLADKRRLAAGELRQLSIAARGLLEGWQRCGWLHPLDFATNDGGSRDE